MAQQLSPGTENVLNMHYGYVGTRLLVRFTQRIDHVWLTLEQVDAMVQALIDTKAKLIAHQANPPAAQN